MDIASINLYNEWVYILNNFHIGILLYKCKTNIVYK